MAARLRPENTRAAFGVVEDDPFDETSEHSLGRWFKIGLHMGRRIIRFVSWRSSVERLGGELQRRSMLNEN